jgi:hypothetical protein
VSARAFQAALSRLALEPDFRARVSADGDAALDGDLTPLERRRLAAVAGDPGMDLTAFLIRSFRLGKIVTLLPLTRTLLGNKRLADEAQRFWSEHPPTSFYFLEEALAFCDHLLARPLRVKYLDEVVGYERTMLELKRVRTNGDRPAPQPLAFDHDPVQLLTTLAAGRRPRAVPEQHCVMVATLDEDDAIQWQPA